MNARLNILSAYNLFGTSSLYLTFACLTDSLSLLINDSRNNLLRRMTYYVALRHAT